MRWIRWIIFLTHYIAKIISSYIKAFADFYLTVTYCDCGIDIFAFLWYHSVAIKAAEENKKMNYIEEKNYIGNTAQLFKVKEYRFCGGRCDGVRAVDVSTGAGLSFTVLIDRCMDIYYLDHKGKNLAYQTPVGITDPRYFNRSEWMQGFGAGFFVTCGLENIGSSCVDGDEELPCHGRVSYIQAQNFSVNYVLEDGVPAVILHGEMAQCRMFSTQMVLTREIKCKYGENRIYINDTVRNGDARETPHMMLYHFNMGYPLLDENAEVIIPSEKRVGRSPLAEEELELWDKFIPPVFGYEERCYYHYGMQERNGRVAYGMKNKVSDLGVKITYNNDSLTHFNEWKMMGINEYVCGLEPCNATIEGRKTAREDGTLKLLKPGESVKYSLDIQVGSYSEIEF